MAKHCKNCGLKTSAKKKCGHCKHSPESSGPMASHLLSVSPDTRRQLLSCNLINEISIPSFVPNIDIQPLDLSLEATTCAPDWAVTDTDATEPIGNQTVASNDGNSSRTETDSDFAEQEVNIDPSDWMCFPIEMVINYVRFGTYLVGTRSLIFEKIGFSFGNIWTNTSENIFSYMVSIDFAFVTELKYCLSPSVPLILLKTNQLFCELIQTTLDVAPDSANGLVFDVNSDEPNKSYIVVSLKRRLVETIASLLTKLCKQRNNSVEVESIDENAAKAIIHFKDSF